MPLRIAFFCWLLALSISALWAGDTAARFYYQPEWGTTIFQLLREPDGGLRVRAERGGIYTFRDDGATAEGFAALAATWRGVGRAQIVPLATDEMGVVWRGHPAREGENRWERSDFAAPGAGGGPAALASLRWEVTWKGPGEAVLARCVLSLRDGENRALFADGGALPPWSLPAPIPEAPEARPAVNAATPRIIVAGDAVPLLDPDRLALWSRWGRRLGIDLGGSEFFSDMAPGVRAYRRAGMFTLFESHVAFFSQRAWARNRGLFMTRDDGFTPDAPLWPAGELANADTYDQQCVDTTREETFALMRDRLRQAFDLGCDGFLLIDYAWPYFGGRWGYGSAATVQWKAYLNGTSRRIDLAGPDESWSFADYWARFSSLPLVPATFGWRSWDDFSAAQDGPLATRRLLLFDALWHFHHLVFADRLGREAETRGREFAVSLNAEDPANGADYALFGRLRHLGAMGVEFFGSPSILPALRHTLAPLRWREGGPHIDLIGELAPGGHGPSRMDPATAAVFYYEAAASCLPRFYNNQYVEGPWPERRKLDAEGRERFDAWAVGAAAFLLRHDEEAQAQAGLPRPDVTVVASRSILEPVAGSSHSLDQEGNLAPYLDALHVDFAQEGRDAWSGADDGHSRVVVFCPARATPGQLRGVKAWLGAGEGKVLIVVGGSPWRTDREGETDAALGSVAVTGKPRELTLGGTSLSTSWWDAAVPDKSVLLADAHGVPLLTGWSVGPNRVLHLNADLPAAPLSPLGLALVREAAARAGIVPFAPAQPDWNLDRYEVSGGAVVAAWNRPLLAHQEATPEGRDQFAHVALTVPGQIVLSAPPGMACRLYSALDDRAWLQTADVEGRLRVEAAASPLLLYYGPDTPLFRQTIARAARAFHPVSGGSVAR